MQKENRKYYEAYEDRYKTAHEKGVSWTQMKNTPIVMDIIKRYHLHPEQSLLEIGCGEGRDSATVLENGFHLIATDISPEAINYCKKKMPDFESKFMVLDCLSSDLDEKFDFIYSVAVVHMLVLDEDRNGFYQFIHRHLKSDGIALICSMGDGNYEMQSDISNAFELQEREHETGKMMVAGTSCRMVSFSTFENELLRNGLKIIEKGITSAMPNFSREPSKKHCAVNRANLIFPIHDLVVFSRSDLVYNRIDHKEDHAHDCDRHVKGKGIHDQYHP